MESDLLTTRDIEQRLQISRVTIYRLIRDEGLPAIRVGSQWRFPSSAVEAWLKNREEALSVPALQADDGDAGESLFTPAQAHLLDAFQEMTGIEMRLSDAPVEGALCHVWVGPIKRTVAAIDIGASSPFTRDQVAVMAQLLAASLGICAELDRERHQLQGCVDEISSLIAMHI